MKRVSNAIAGLIAVILVGCSSTGGSSNHLVVQSCDHAEIKSCSTQRMGGITLHDCVITNKTPSPLDLTGIVVYQYDNQNALISEVAFALVTINPGDSAHGSFDEEDKVATVKICSANPTSVIGKTLHWSVVQIN